MCDAGSFVMGLPGVNSSSWHEMKDKTSRKEIRRRSKQRRPDRASNEKEGPVKGQGDLVEKAGEGLELLLARLVRCLETKNRFLHEAMCLDFWGLAPGGKGNARI